ncbi:hypothetical protein S245_042462 [Arachis hypogaea]
MLSHYLLSLSLISLAKRREKKLRLVFLGFIIVPVHEMESHNIPIFSGTKATGAVTKTASATSSTPFWPFAFREHFQMNLVCPSFPTTLVAIDSSTPLRLHNADPASFFSSS